jgi:hypothetical protein
VSPLSNARHEQHNDERRHREQSNRELDRERLQKSAAIGSEPRFRAAEAPGSTKKHEHVDEQRQRQRAAQHAMERDVERCVEHDADRPRNETADEHGRRQVQQDPKKWVPRHDRKLSARTAGFDLAGPPKIPEDLLIPRSGYGRHSFAARARVS